MTRPAFALLALAFAAAGCGPSDTAPVAKASYDPDKAVQAALDEFDQDKDGTLSAAELDACPALKGAVAQIDTNKDRKLSREELKARFASYADAGVGASGVPVRVTLNGTPVSGAVVTFTPEKCLGAGLTPAKGTSDASGAVQLVREDGVPGLSPGLYRVSISGAGVHPDYASRPLLGFEVSGGGRGGNSADFNLVAKPK